MDQSQIAEAVKQICDEKGVPVAAVIATIEAALAAAYRKDFGEKNQNIKVEFDLETGKIKVFDIKTVVEDMPPEEEKTPEQLAAEAEAAEQKLKEQLAAGAVTMSEEEIRRFNPKTEIQITDAKTLNKKHEIGDEIKTALEVPGDFGRMAAQTAKQVIIQKLRETERETQFEEYKKKEGEILVGTVQRREGNLVLVDLGRITALLPPDEQIRNENYVPGGHLKVYVVSVNSTTKGPEVIVSRSHPEIVKKLFALEIPEISSGVVQIKSVAREAGGRSKIAVWTDQENIDPIGSCIGQRGARIQTIITELKGEKVDIIKYSEDPKEFIANALSPAKILQIDLNETEKTATAKVAEDQLSLAIGRAGQNVRLAARLTGWKIDIVSGAGKVAAADETAAVPEAEAAEEIAVPENGVTAEPEGKADPAEKKGKKTKVKKEKAAEKTEKTEKKEKKIKAKKEKKEQQEKE